MMFYVLYFTLICYFDDNLWHANVDRRLSSSFHPLTVWAIVREKFQMLTRF